MDALGRIVVPKALREQLHLQPGMTLDISWYDEGLRLIPQGRVARLQRDDEGRLVGTSTTVVTDDMVFDLMEVGRR